MFGLIRRPRNWVNKPSTYSIWKATFDCLQKEKKQNGMGSEYWRIWYEEVCPAYRKLTESTPKFLRHRSTDDTLEDMDKPLSERKYY